ncbi:MAG: ABC transporter permease [Lachnospiraceae bacterium]|jgi:teichoic acid transport system permease protein|nr:ABC transporter permease [Lachnospiraceae bacterium]
MKRFMKEMKQYWGFAVYSAKCDLKAEVANSFLNWLWWILEPMSSMIIYAVVFSVLMSSREDYYPVFIFIGITFWEFFNRCTMSSISLIRGNAHIITKVYMPKYILLVERMLVLAFKLLINLGLIAIMLLIFRVKIGINILMIIPTLVVFFTFCFAAGLLMMHYGVYISDLQKAMAIVLNLGFYITGIFYSVQDKFPQPYGYILQRANPMAHLIFCFRKCLLKNEMPSLIMLSVWFVISIIIIIYSLNKIYKNENDYVKMI